VEIAFYGGNFLGMGSRRITGLLAIAADYIHQGKADGIRFSTRPDTIDREKLEVIADFPVSTVELGVQSMNDDVLQLTRRGHTSEDTLRAVALLKKEPYQLGLQMMVGLPGDSDARAMCTGRRLVECAPDFVRIYPTLVLKDSLLARWHADRRYSPLKLDRCIQLVKTLFLMFTRRGIRVIRMGLQPTSELNDKAMVLAGPYHPAFGELVHAAVFLETVLKHIGDMPHKPNTLQFTIHPKHLSRLYGQKRSNFNTLQSVLNPCAIDVVTDADLSFSTILINGRPCRLPV
jgi:histone acetyltransferase (RNA polymerase elongator complex component)